MKSKVIVFDTWSFEEGIMKTKLYRKVSIGIEENGSLRTGILFKITSSTFIFQIIKNEPI